MTPRSEEQKANRAARRRQVAREMRLLLKRVASLGDEHVGCLVCGARHGDQHRGSCVVGDTRKWLAIHRDGDGA